MTKIEDPNKEKILLACKRKEIDAIDTKIIELLGERFSIVNKVAIIKKKYKIRAILEDRIRTVIEQNISKGKKHNIDSSFMHKLYELIINASIEQEEKLINSKNKCDS